MLTIIGPLDRKPVFLTGHEFIRPKIVTQSFDLDVMQFRNIADLTPEPITAGVFRLVATATGPQGGNFRDEDILVVRPPTVEIERVARDGAVLAALGQATGGAYTEVSGLDGVARRIQGVSIEEDERFRRLGESEIWDAWSVLALILFLVFLEWYWRRKAGIL